MTSDMKAALSLSLPHTHEWLEGKSSCCLSMTSNKRTIENNKTALRVAAQEGEKKVSLCYRGQLLSTASFKHQIVSAVTDWF